MIEFLNGIDHSLFLFLNGLHNEFWDKVVIIATKGIVWLPVYLAFLYLVIRKFGWKTLIVIVFAALTVLISDQLCELVKNMAQRLRPSHEPGLTVHLVNAYKGGEWGFYSAHASNSFSVAIFLIVLLCRHYRYVYIPALLWALLLSYTRIYLGVHFPGDTLTGMIIGSLIGWGMGYACLFTLKKGSIFFPKKNKN